MAKKAKQVKETPVVAETNVPVQAFYVVGGKAANFKVAHNHAKWDALVAFLGDNGNKATVTQLKGVTTDPAFVTYCINKCKCLIPA